MAGAVERAAVLPALREDLSLFAGPPNAFGAPTWTVYDPPGNRFIRIGWPEFEIISRWRAGGTAEALARDVSRQTTLSIDGAAVDALVTFLGRNNLLQIAGTGQVRRMRLNQEAARPSLATRLFRSHLFFRLPLLRPTPLLAALQPVARLLYSRAFLLLTLLAGMLGLFLAARQWDRFIETAVTLFDWSSLVLIACTVITVKILHELGHALTAHRYGCHVPTMGVAFMVLWPVLYTDTTDAWKLTSKQQRLAISGAGVCTELIIAAYATLAWTFLPEGPLQSAAFLVATTTWILSVLVNLNPFMRFDGYFLFSDLLEVENLQERAFALARWRLRESLFGFGDPPPEAWPRGKRVVLLLYAYLTWAYRAALFIGIALLIYHFLFKLAGLLLFVLEIVLLVGLPIHREMKRIAQRSGDLSMNRQTVTTIALLAAVTIGVFTPWATRLSVPSVLQPYAHTVVYAPVTAQVERISVEEGARVRNDTPVVQLISQDLDNVIAVAQTEVAILTRREAFERFDAARRQDRLIIESQLRTARVRLANLLQERRALTVAAPMGGTVVEIAEDVRSGEWIAEGEPLLMIAEDKQKVIEAYIPEHEVKRIAIGAAAVFYPENIDDAPVRGVVESIDQVAINNLDNAYMSAAHDGGIAVTETETGGLVPKTAHYRARVALVESSAPITRIIRGTTSITADTESLAARAWNAVFAIIVRESGF